MPMTTITARVDASDKNAFDEFCTSVGLSTSAAVNMFVKAVLRERKIPFEIRQEDPFYSESNLKRLMESEEQYRSGKVIRKTMEELEAMADE